MSRKYLAFDLETAKVQPPDDQNWREDRPLGISCEATLCCDAGEPMLWYGLTRTNRPAREMSHNDAKKLVNYLSRMVSAGYTIVTWNGVGFDFDILAEESGTFGSSVASGTATVALNGACPSLAALTFNNAAASYTITPGSGGALSMNNGPAAVLLTDAAGNHVIAAPLVFNSTTVVTVNNSGVTLAVSGPVSGSGGLAKSGPGTLVLSTSNTYTGTTTINTGTVAAAAAETPGISGPFGAQAANAAGTILFGGGTSQYSAANQFDYSGRFSTAGGQPISIDTNGQTVTFASNIQGASTGLTLNDSVGTGKLILAGSNTYTGGTTITAGTLQGNTASLQGAVANNAALVFNQAAVGTFAGSITGSGSVAITGGGQVALAGPATLSGSGPIAVNQGTLTAPLGIPNPGSSITLASGGTLQAGGQVKRAVSGGGGHRNCRPHHWHFHANRPVQPGRCPRRRRYAQCWE